MGWSKPAPAGRGILGAMKAGGTAPQLDEGDLVRRARLGDRPAFDRLVEAHLPRVWRVVWRTLRHREDTEDVVQEVFLTAFEGLAGYREEASFATWLHRIAVTRALNHLDRSSEKMRRASRSIDGAADDGPWAVLQGGRSLASDSPTPLRVLESKELLRRVSACLEKVPGALRAVLALRDGESLSYEEIARSLDLAIGTVRSRLARARMSLKHCVEGGA